MTLTNRIAILEHMTLLHILYELHRNHGITLEILKNLEQSIRRQIIPAKRLALIDKSYRGREGEKKLVKDSRVRNL